MSRAKETTLTFFFTYLPPLKPKACAAKIDFLDEFNKNLSFKIAIKNKIRIHISASQSRNIIHTLEPLNKINHYKMFSNIRPFKYGPQKCNTCIQTKCIDYIFDL